MTPSLANVPSPTLTPIPNPQPGDGTTLQWRIFSPSGSGPWPAILLLHGGAFKEGDPKSAQIATVAGELVAAGYYVAVATYRLAPWGLITGQPCHQTSSLSGRPPEQTDNVKRLVKALRADSHCNGKVGVVGGSAGGSHAVTVALDINSSGNVWPFWTETDRADCAVSISGAYQYDDRTPENYSNGFNPLPYFAGTIENYTNSSDPQTQRNLSPVSLVITPSTQHPFKPLFLINSLEEQMPYHQIVDMICTLQAHGVSVSDYKTLTISGNDHSFAIWFDWDEVTPIGSLPAKTVGGDVIDFLDAHLK